jgi:hypothetical protein
MNSQMLQEADFSKSVLRGASLHHSDLKGCQMEHSSLEAACMHGVYMKVANLKHANMEGADLSFSNLSGVILRKVQLNLHTRNRQKDDLIEFLSEIRSLETLRDDQSFRTQIVVSADKYWRLHGPKRAGVQSLQEEQV